MNDTVIESNTAVTIDLGLHQEEWFVHWTTNAHIDCDTCVVVSINSELDAEVSVFLAHVSGCTFESNFNIRIKEVQEDLYIPNIFSPNGDGQNDEWNIYTTDNIEIISLKVLDRWGNLVHSSQSNHTKWDGRSGSRFVVQGVYIYQLHYTDNFGEKHIQKGDITLIR